MRTILSFLQKWVIRKKPEKQMGRWNIDYCDKKINSKIDLSNEDHCGHCGQYALTKIETINKNIISTDNTTKNISSFSRE
jgi:hypothetical protein